MNKITERIKYSIANDITFDKDLAIATNHFCDGIGFSVKAAKTVNVISYERDSICDFRKALKNINNVSYKRIGNIDEINSKYDTLLLSEDMESFLPTNGFSRICDTVIMPIVSDEAKLFAEKVSGEFKNKLYFVHSKKGDYHNFSLCNLDDINDYAIAVFSNVEIEIKTGYMVLVKRKNDSEENVIEEITDKLSVQSDTINGLYEQIAGYQRNLYLLTGPLRVFKRILIKFPPIKLFLKCIKAYREGGFALLKSRTRSFLGLSKLNDDSAEYANLFLNKNEYISYDAEYQNNIDFSDKKTDVKMLAYYLPQYHSFKENDEWWGKGFTEWCNTRVAKPRFAGHYQPRIPHSDIGYYDLSNIETMKKQAELAKQHGIYGFCFYYYWFSGKRLMEKPVDMLLEHPEIDIPFCLCWANENWTRAWDGQNRDVLIAQDYSEEDDERFISDMKPYIDDSRYIKINGKPLVVVYNPGQIPDCKKSFNKWRERAKEIGIGEILIWTCRTANNTAKNLGIEDYIDAEIEFPPHNTWLDAFTERNINLNGATASIFNYQKLVDGIEYDYKTGKDKRLGKKPVHHACMMAWDNAARRKNNWFTYHYYSLKSLYRWVSLICQQARRDFDEEERFVFINAWNEWAEGTYLEPDKKYGYANINTVSKALVGEPFVDDIEVINTPVEPSKTFDKKIAVQVHMFYTETLDETIENLNKIPYNFDCYFSTDTEEKAEVIRNELKDKCKCNNFTVEIFSNRGRDVAPFIFQMADRIDDYDYICHIHSKRTVTGDHGNDWRRYIFKHLFGNAGYLSNIFDMFEKDENLGMVFPETFSPLEYQAQWGGNLEKCMALLDRLGVSVALPQDPQFPVGNMFWAKTDAIRAMFKLGLKPEDFPKENKQVNSTVAHCIERVWVYLASEYGFSYKKVFNNVMVPVELSQKKRIAFYVHYNKDNIISNDDIESLKAYSTIFDNIIFISNSPIGESDLDEVKKYTSTQIFRENKGFDFAAWKEGIKTFGYENIKKYDQVALINNSTFAPIYDMKNVFAEMEGRNNDFWGITLFPEIKEKNYLKASKISEHIQSFFVVFEKKVIESGEIKKFFEKMKYSDEFIDAVKNGEVALTAHMRKCGFNYSPYITESYYICEYLMDYRLPYDKPLSLVKIGSPLIKKKAYAYMLDTERINLENFVEKLKKA